VRELKETALAALNRPKHGRQEAELKPPAASERTKAAQRQPAAAMIEESRVEDFHDFDTPLRPGAIIGDDESAQPAVRPGIPTVKPLIDVRRGIFPGRRSDDFDEDESDEPTPARPPSPRPQSKGRPRATRSRPAAKGAPAQNGRPQRKDRLKGKTRRRDSSPAKPSSPSKAPKHLDRRKGRRR
jgi:hypothetical protein